MKIFRLGFYGLVLAVTFVIGLTSSATARYLFSLLPAQAKTQDVPIQSPPPMEVLAEGQVTITDSLGEIEQTENTSVDEFNPSGYYFPDLDKLPKGFSDFNHIYLETHEVVDEDGEYVDRPIVPKGSVSEHKEFTFTRVAVGTNNFSFQTEAIKGVSYRFTGRFLNSLSGDYCETEEDQPELEGKLIKIKDGKWAAEMKAQFYISCGC